MYDILEDILYFLALICFAPALAFVGANVRFYSVTSNNKYRCKPNQNTPTYVGTPNHIRIMGRNTKISFIILMWHSWSPLAGTTLPHRGVSSPPPRGFLSPL